MMHYIFSNYIAKKEIIFELPYSGCRSGPALGSTKVFMPFRSGVTFKTVLGRLGHTVLASLNLAAGAFKKIPESSRYSPRTPAADCAYSWGMTSRHTSL
jgi:hypothetical protein